MRRREGRSCLGTVVAVVLGIVVLGWLARRCWSTANTTTTTTNSPASTQAVAPADFKEWLQWTTERELGAKSNLNGPRVRSVDFEGGDKTRPVVAILADDNLTHNLIRLGMLQDAAKLLQAVFADSRASVLSVGLFRPMADVYGNNQGKLVMLIQMSRETANKINWDNFLMDNLASVADNFYEMPGWQ